LTLITLPHYCSKESATSCLHLVSRGLVCVGVLATLAIEPAGPGR
jgi:hypothetical protein